MNVFLLALFSNTLFGLIGLSEDFNNVLESLKSPIIPIIPIGILGIPKDSNWKVSSEFQGFQLETWKPWNCWNGIGMRLEGNSENT
jgi:hypothetical protein